VNEHGVVIAGGGPTGTMLAAELTLAGTDVVVVEPRPGHLLESSRGRGLHTRTLEVLDQRGIVDRFLDEGQTAQVISFAGVPLDMSDFPTRHPYGLALLQPHVERLLGDWVADLGVPFLRERAVTGLHQDDDGVDVELSDGTTLRAAFLVGCDGGRSTVRSEAGIELAGWDATTSWVIAEVEMTEEPQVGVRRAGGGIGPVDFQKGGSPYGVALPEPELEHQGEATMEDLRVALVAAYGTDYGAHDPTWVSRFTDAARQAVTYRQGRVLLAGDAAHVHPPVGGQGLNTGVQDAVNLGWKLAQVVAGTSPDDLLDTYHAERHPVAARVLRTTMAQTALADPDDRNDALRELVADLMGLDQVRKRMLGELSQLDLHYDLGGDHPLVGRRVPDLDLADGRLYELLHDARPLLLTFGDPFDVSPWPRVKAVDTTYDGAWELPVVGEVPPPDAVLVRPDGHVAWVGPLDDPSLPGALTTWFG
jgi:3-(3-hydroxy-phenyl)propionate hydroxylase